VKISGVSARAERFDLLRPYRIAGGSFEAVSSVILELRSGERLGLGAASPDQLVTGETPGACLEALSEERLHWLIGRDVRGLPGLARELARSMPRTPAARAAVDMALHDLLAQQLGIPLVEMLGRVHEGLPTSITVGIKDLAGTLAEAREYVSRGFRVLKVKLEGELQEDVERLRRLREELGAELVIRVDVNQGYSRQQLLAFCAQTAPLDIELIEQPLPAVRPDPMWDLPGPIRARLAADESVHDEADALRLSRPPRACGIFNIKLMKCGGIWPALRMASVAELAGIELMWGCMDESVIGISAALHAALASPATRYLDLDGSLDLARDVARGGFVLSDGFLRTSERPGLGVDQL